MSQWKKASMDTLFYEFQANIDEDCEVLIDDGFIKVKYMENDEEVIYSGTEESPGHFVLSCPSLDGKATLHRFLSKPGLPESKILVGSWVQDTARGLWKITLS